VRVVTGQIGVDAADRHSAGLLVRRAGGLEQRSTDARETVGLNGRIRFLVACVSAGLGSCSVVWSQSGGVLAMTLRQKSCAVQYSAVRK